MTFEGINALFTPAEQFPVSVCTIQNEREPNVHDSCISYFCMVIDTRFEGCCSLRVLTPYTVEIDGALLYGWQDAEGNCIGNISNTAVCDEERVLSFTYYKPDADVSFWKRIATKTEEH